MKMIEGKDAIFKIVVVAVAFSPIWGTVGVLLTAKLHSMFSVRDVSGFLVLLGMGAPLGGWIFWFYKTNILKRNEQRMEMVNTTKRGDTDFYHCTEVNSIAISTASRMITVFRSKRMFNKKADVDMKFDIPIEKLRGYRAHAPGHTVQSTNGPAVTQGIDMAIDAFRNAQSAQAAGITTGLYLELDDVMNPEIFVRMDFEDAKRWFLLLEKLENGTLDKQQPAMFYPRESRWAPA